MALQRFRNIETSACVAHSCTLGAEVLLCFSKMIGRTSSMLPRCGAAANMPDRACSPFSYAAQCGCTGRPAAAAAGVLASCRCPWRSTHRTGTPMALRLCGGDRRLRYPSGYCSGDRPHADWRSPRTHQNYLVPNNPSRLPRRFRATRCIRAGLAAVRFPEKRTCSRRARHVRVAPVGNQVRGNNCWRDLTSSETRSRDSRRRTFRFPCGSAHAEC